MATLAEKAYESALALAERTYSPLVIPPEDWPFDKEASPFTKVLALDAEKLQCTGELFRLWLDQKGFRFPIETFPEKGENKAFPSKQSYRNRFIEKCRHIVWIFDQSTARKSENLYFLKDKLDFSHVDGTWRYPQKDDVLLPLDSKISSRPLRQWLQEKGVPQWIRPYLRVLAKENWVHFVSGIRTKRKD